MKKAELHWSLYIQCPQCLEDNNLADYDDDKVVATALFNNAWDKLKGYKVTCDECGNEFEVDEVESWN